MGFLRQLHRAGGAVEEIREEMPPDVELRLGKIVAVEIKKVEGEKDGLGGSALAPRPPSERCSAPKSA